MSALEEELLAKIPESHRFAGDIHNPRLRGQVFVALKDHFKEDGVVTFADLLDLSQRYFSQNNENLKQAIQLWINSQNRDYILKKGDISSFLELFDESVIGYRALQRFSAVELIISSNKCDVKLSEVLELAALFKSEGRDVKLFCAWLRNPLLANLSFEEVDTLSATHFSDHKFKIYEAWFKNSNSVSCSIEDLLSMLSKCDNIYQRVDLCKAWIGNPNTETLTFDQWQDIISQAINGGFEDSIVKKELVATSCFSWVKNSKLPLTVKDLEILVEKIPWIDKKELCSYFVKNKQNKGHLTLEQFRELLNFIDPDIIYETKGVAKLYNVAEMNFPLKEAATYLYPNIELLQIDFYIDVIENALQKYTFQQAPNKENIQRGLKELDLSYIRDGSLVLDFASEIQEICGNADSLRFCRGRVAAQYQTILEIFKDKKVESCLMPDGVEFFCEILSITAEELNSLPFVDLFSYCDITGAFEDLKDYLQDGLLKQIISNYRAPSDVLIVKKLEMEKLAELFAEIPEEATEEEAEPILETKLEEIVTSFFIPNKLLCDRFNVAEFFVKLTAAEIENLQINFSNSSIKEEAQIQLNEKLKAALQTSQPQDVLGFFKDLFELEADFSDEDKRKLQEVWIGFKYAIARLVQMPDGINTIVNSMYSLSDGCSANLGSQLSLVICQTSLQQRNLLSETRETEPLDRIIDSLLMEIEISTIVPNIFRGFNDEIGAHSNPFENEVVTSSCLCPEALFAEIAKSLKPHRAATIVEKVFEKQQRKIFDVLEENFEDLECDICHFAAYLVFRHAFGQDKAAKLSCSEKMEMIVRGENPNPSPAPEVAVKGAVPAVLHQAAAAAAVEKSSGR